jgi:hypothetical protein
MQGNYSEPTLAEGWRAALGPESIGLMEAVAIDVSSDTGEPVQIGSRG